MYKKYLIGIGIALLCTIIFYSCDSLENNTAEYNKVLHNQLMTLGPPDVNVTRGVEMDNILTYTWYNKYIGDVIHVLGKPDEIIHDIYTDVEADRFFKHIRIKPSKIYSPLSYKTILFRYGKYYFKEGHNILMCVYSLNGSPVIQMLSPETYNTMLIEAWNRLSEGERISLVRNKIKSEGEDVAKKELVEIFGLNDESTQVLIEHAKSVLSAIEIEEHYLRQTIGDRYDRIMAK